MKTTKKVLGIVLALTLVVSCVAMAFTSFAVTDNGLDVEYKAVSDKTSISAGETFTVTVSVAKAAVRGTNDGASFINSMRNTISYPADKVEYVSSSDSKTNFHYTDGAIQDNGSGDIAIKFSAAADGIRVGESGELYKVTFKVKDSVTDGFDLTFTCGAPDEWSDDYGNTCEDSCTYQIGATVTDKISYQLLVPATGIDMATDSKDLIKGNTTSVSATITPAGFNDGATIVWSSSNEAVATVAADGTVTGVANGEATITATLSTDDNITASYKVTVKTAATSFDADVNVDSALKADETEADQYNLTLNGKFSATDIGAMFTNKTGVSDFSVYVDLTDGTAVKLENGVISYEGVGEATLEVAVLAYDGTNVTPLGVKTIKVTVAALLPTTDNVVVAGDDALTVGGEGQMSVSAPANATDTTVTDVKYTSSDATIVSIDETTGAYKALKEGEATLTYTAKNANGDDITATLTVTVTAASQNTEDGGDNTGNNGGNNTGNNGGNTGDAGVALAATLSLAAAAAFVFSKKRG